MDPSGLPTGVALIRTRSLCLTLMHARAALSDAQPEFGWVPLSYGPNEYEKWFPGIPIPEHNIDLLRLELIKNKEVIQPQVPLRLPCDDLTHLTELRFDTVKKPWLI